jgi:sirohydrochlorin cobaltochelatase
MNKPTTAVVLFAHGSRDPLWRAPMDKVAQHMRAQAPDTLVQCAFLELCPPDLPTAVQDLLDQGHRNIRIVPMFLGMGRHAREDLPTLVKDLRQSHPHMQLEVVPSVGESPELIRCLADLALRSADKP